MTIRTTHAGSRPVPRSRGVNRCAPWRVRSARLDPTSLLQDQVDGVVKRQAEITDIVNDGEYGHATIGHG